MYLILLLATVFSAVHTFPQDTYDISDTGSDNVDPVTDESTHKANVFPQSNLDTSSSANVIMIADKPGDPLRNTMDRYTDGMANTLNSATDGMTNSVNHATDGMINAIDRGTGLMLHGLDDLGLIRHPIKCHGKYRTPLCCQDGQAPAPRALHVWDNLNRCVRCR